MAVPGIVEIVFDNSIKRSENKVVNPTRALMTAILEEAGFDGAWGMKDSRRIKKKGRERFGAIRIESRSGAKSIRIWCKPRGNDTAFEYSLSTPEGTDLQMSFAVLKRVNPVTLKVAESPSLPMAVLSRAIDLPSPLPLREEPIVEVEDSPSVPAKEAPSEVGTQAEKEMVARELDGMALLMDFLKSNEGASDEEVREHAEASGVQVSQSMISSVRGILGRSGPPRPKAEKEGSESFPSMELDPSILLSDPEAMDRALMAIGFVMEFGYAKKSDASSAIIRHLGLRRFTSGQSQFYKSIEGAMRALTMALRKNGRYIERVRCDPVKGGVSEGIKGYRLTAAGERRINTIKGKFGPMVESMLNPNWPRSGGQQRLPQTQTVSHGEVVAAVGAGSVTRIKELVSAFERAERQVKEVDDVLKATDEDMANLRLDMEALEISEREKLKQISQMQEEVERIVARRDEASRKLAQKEKERKEWEDMKAPHKQEYDRIGGLLSAMESKA